MSGIGLTTTPSVEIISTYTATNQRVPAVAVAPGWYVVGAEYLASSADGARLQMIGAVSDPSLTLSVRLFDVTAGAPVSGALASVSALADARAISGPFSVIATHLYQFQMQVVGGAGDAFFGVMNSASLF